MANKISTFNIVFEPNDQMHRTYNVKDGKISDSGRKMDESELPKRLEGIRFLGVSSVTIFIPGKKFKSFEWRKLLVLALNEPELFDSKTITEPGIMFTGKELVEKMSAVA